MNNAFMFQKGGQKNDADFKHVLGSSCFLASHRGYQFTIGQDKKRTGNR